MTKIIDKIIYSLMFIVAALGLYFIYQKNLPKSFQTKTIYTDAIPTKKKPSNPGGVKFHDTDKSVYNFVSPDHKRSKNIKKNNVYESKNFNNQTQYMQVLTKELSDIFEYSTGDTANNLQTVDTNSSMHFTKFVNIQILNDQDARFKSSNKNDAEIYPNQFAKDNKDHVSDDNAKNYTLQLYIAKTYQRAEEERIRITDIHKDIISNIPYSIYKKNMQDNGIIYQLNLGSFTNFSKASIVCKKLLKRHQSCIIKQIKNL